MKEIDDEPLFDYRICGGQTVNGMVMLKEQ